MGTEAWLKPFERLQGSGPGWLKTLRKQGMARFSASGFPTLQDEDWRYTNLAPLAEALFAPAPEAGLGAGRLAHVLFGSLGGIRLVFVNGRFVPGLSDAGEPAPGVTVRSLSEALTAFPDLVEPHLARLSTPDSGAVPALNAAFLEDGALVRLGCGASVARPIHLLFLSSPVSGPVASHPRTLITLSEGAQATVVETYASLGAGASLTNAVTEADVGPGASLDHVRLQVEGEGAWHLASLQARVDRDAKFASHAVSVGASLSRNEVRVRLDAPGAQARLDGLYLASGNQRTDHPTWIDHAAPDGTSVELYKGILHGSSRGAFTGRIRVRPQAQRTDARQQSRSLLLSDDAEADSRPQLQIDADDVACSHGATVGRLDEAALFYMQSRGIGHEAASSLLTYAFADEVVAPIPVEAVRTQMASLLCGWLTRSLGHGVFL